ncbi:DUF3226 domain-containing protein [Flavobacterium columnare]|uniref:DUF3226 domain-containing protein n=1 Tax=Flavobacterium columnare TaxID=996 RepID=UPI00403419AB
MEDLNFRIFCEGISDQRYLRDFLNVHYNIEVTDKDLKGNRYIQVLQSWNTLPTFKEKITETFSDYTSLIFLDADDEKVIDKAGFAETLKFVEDLMNEWKWDKFDVFVLPNNQDIGTIEDLLENVINKKNEHIFDCWNEFENCLGKNNSLTIPAKKSKIYNYLECLHGLTNQEKDKCKDPNRDFKDENLWEIKNLENPYIVRMKDFFDKHIQK